MPKSITDVHSRKSIPGASRTLRTSPPSLLLAPKAQAALNQISSARQRLGRMGEELACLFLLRNGLLILDRNWRCALGELDIVALDGTTTVFVEVKTRSSSKFGGPEYAITLSKGIRLRRLAVQWMLSKGRRPHRIRVDLIGITLYRDTAPEFRHIKGIV